MWGASCSDVIPATARCTRQPGYPYQVTPYGPISRGMNLDLTDDEKTALIRELDGIIRDDRYPLSPRILMLKA